MHTLVFILVLIAAFTHALWNFFSKKVSGNFIIFWYGSYIVNILLFGYTFYLISVQGFDTRVLPYLITSSAAHFVYYITFLYTYSKGDISTVYPIARGTGVAGTAVISYFFFNEAISPLAAIGIASVFLGIMCIGFSRYGSQRLDKKTFLIAIFTGVTIFIYSLADKQGVMHINPVAYINFIDLAALTPLMILANRNGFKKSFVVFKANFKEALIIGLGSTGTYIIILFALQLEKASYIVSMREFSVVFASLMGFIFLKEKPTVLKIIGITCVTAGLILIKAS